MRRLFTFCFLLLSLQMFSRNNIIDSLQQKLSQAKGSEKILQLNELAIAYWTVNPAKSITLGKEALVLAKQFNFYKAKARTYNIIGGGYSYLKKYALANTYYDKSLKAANKYGTNKDIYNSLLNKIYLYNIGFLKDTVKGPDTYKRFIDLTIEKGNYLEFSQSLMGFITVFHKPGTNDSMLFNYIHKLSEYRHFNDKFRASLYGGEGYLYRLNKIYFKAIASYGKALKYIRDDDILKVTYLINIGTIYSETDMNEKSVPYFKDGLGLLKSQKPVYTERLGTYIDACLGASYNASRKYKLALPYLLLALDNLSIFNLMDRAILFNNTGMAYLFTDSLKLAEHYINRSVSLFDSLNNKDGKISSLNSLAQLFIRQHKEKKLSKTIKKIALLVTNDDYSYNAQDGLSLLSDYYNDRGDYRKSNEYLQKWIKVHDSILNKKNRYALDEFEIKYQTEKKDKEIKIQKAAIIDKNLKFRYLLLGGGIVFMALIIIVFLYIKRNQAYKQLVYQSLDIVGKNKHKTEEEDIDETNKKAMPNYQNSINEELMQQITRLLEKQIESKIFLEPNLSIKQLAEKCNTNRTYLSQIIHEKYHMNFNNFINKYRIEEAKQILVEQGNKTPLKALYERLGFSSYTRFHEAFKKYTGVTPSFFLKTIMKL